MSVIKFIVSIHAPTWGATPELGASFTTVNVSIHAPTWGATDSGAMGKGSSGFQSTHPRGVRPNPTKHHTDGLRVSIHAPTWGATDVVSGTFAHHAVSIHAPTWGATPRIKIQQHKQMFQSTHPRGVRHQ